MAATPLTDELERSLAHWAAPMPRGLERRFSAYLREKELKQLLITNLLAQLTYLAFWFADCFLIADVRWTSLVVRVTLLAICAPIALTLMRRSTSTRLINLLLPAQALIATVSWLILLCSSSSPYVGLYIYSSLIFVLVATIAVRDAFLESIAAALLITVACVAALMISQPGDMAALGIFALIHGTVLLFSVYICWLNTTNARRSFLHAVRDDELRRELAAANDSLRALAGSDSLTGIANRRQVDLQLSESWRRFREERRPFALMLADVDHFKVYNDTYGHRAGDDCLTRVARILAESLRDGEWFVGRYGGEEFALLVSPADDAAMEAITTRVVRAVSAAAIEHERRPDELDVVTISVGGAVASADVASAEDLLDRADRALYEAKRCGRNRAELALV